MPRITGPEMARVLERAGWQYVRQTGSHRHFSHPDKPGMIVTVPMHAGRTLAIGTQRGIMRDSGLTSQRLRDLL
ncbi:MAG TPA: type II toxin-antitoxin system HicA family toxin [Chloroflexota bacterium]|nr:type II toxin-antitoxin system HicA family toxin [Chloroflexota bacterium]